MTSFESNSLSLFRQSQNASDPRSSQQAASSIAFADLEEEKKEVVIKTPIKKPVADIVMEEQEEVENSSGQPTQRPSGANPVLRLNVYNGHEVDDVAANNAIIISDRELAEKLQEQDRNRSGRSSTDKLFGQAPDA